MLVVQTYKDHAGGLAGLTSAVEFEDIIGRLKLYFSNLKIVRQRILNGEVISLPYITFQKDRRVKQRKVKDERRKKLSKFLRED